MVDSYRASQETDPIYAFRRDSFLSELLFQLFFYFSHPISSGNWLRQHKKNERFSKILTFTEMNYQKPITLEDVAAEVHLQANYFCRFFKETAGISYQRYLNEYRLSRIYQDLIATDIPIGQLLDIHGFSNYNLFRRLFQECFHKTPREVRKSSHVL